MCLYFRKLANQEEAVAMIRSKLSETEWDIEVCYVYNLSLCVLQLHLILSFLLAIFNSGQRLLTGIIIYASF